MLAPGGIAPGDDVRFYYPTSRAVVHSTGDPTLPEPGEEMSWPRYGDRDFSDYAQWRAWLGVFVPELEAPWTAIVNATDKIGMVRVSTSDVVRGNKLFAFGPDFDTSAYTDDGSRYVEMWSGLTPTFRETARLEPGETVSWVEDWYPIAGCPGIVSATARGALYAEARPSGLSVAVMAPRRERWTLVTTQEGHDLQRIPLVTAPDEPFDTYVDLGNPAAPVLVQILDDAGREVISHVVDPRAEAAGR
jgi:hypothetical protein